MSFATPIATELIRSRMEAALGKDRPVRPLVRRQQPKR
jgi:hypothetical protein